MTPAITHPLARRLAAIAVVVAVLVAVGALLSTVVANPIATLLSVAALAVGVTSGWVALTNRGKKRWSAVVLAGLAIVVLAATVIRDEEHGYLLATTIVAVAVAIPAGRFALGREPRPRPGDHGVPPAQAPVLVVNPNSGDGVAQRVGLSEAARSRGIHVLEFDGSRPVLDLVREALEGGADVVGVAGGDGSLAAAAAAVSAAGADFVCVPAGTRNHFALDLGLDRSDVLAALDAFGAARRRRVDLARVNGVPFLNNVSLGLYGEIVQSEGYRDDKVGTALSRLPDLVSDSPDVLGLSYLDPRGERRDTAQVIHVSNNPYVLAGRGMGSRPSLEEGELGIVCARLDGGRAVEVVTRTIFGADHSDSLQSWAAQQFQVDSADPVPAGVDGESMVLDPPLRFESLPAAVAVRLPWSAPGESPAAFSHGYRWTSRELLRRAFRPTSDWRPVPSSRSRVTR